MADNIDKAVDRIEAILAPEGRCAVCGGTKAYWKHEPFPIGEGDHVTARHPFEPEPVQIG